MIDRTPAIDFNLHDDLDRPRVTTRAVDLVRLGCPADPAVDALAEMATQVIEERDALRAQRDSAIALIDDPKRVRDLRQEVRGLSILREAMKQIDYLAGEVDRLREARGD